MMRVRSSARCSVSVIRSSGDVSLGASLRLEGTASFGSGLLDGRRRRFGGCGAARVNGRRRAVAGRLGARRRRPASASTRRPSIGAASTSAVVGSAAASARRRAVGRLVGSASTASAARAAVGRVVGVEVEVGRLLERVGGLAHLAHRLVERRLQLALEAGRHLLELGVRLAELAHRVGQLLRARAPPGHSSRKIDLAAAERLNTLASLRAGTSPVAKPSAAGINGRGCSNGSPRSSTHPIAFAHRGGTGARPGEHARGVRARRSSWAPPAWRATSGSPPTASRCSTTTVWSRRSLGASGRSPSCDAAELPEPHPGARRADRALRHRLPPVARPQGRRESGSAVIDVVREVAPDLLAAAVAVPPDVAVAARRCASRRRASWSTRPGCRGSRRAPSGGRRRCATSGIDAINMHHTDWNGGLVALFHRFERVRVRLGHAARRTSCEPALRMGLDGVYSDWVDRMMDAYTSRARRRRSSTAEPRATASRRWARSPRTRGRQICS